jgi:hypothetical protein
MLSASDAAAKTAMGKIAKMNGPELEIIQQRIEGAASSGSSYVLVEIQGNTLDAEARENIRQVLIDNGYTVALNYHAKTQTARFQISW